jgi:hypothetical protein
MKIEGPSATSVYCYHITRYHIPPDADVLYIPLYKDDSPEVYFGFYRVVYLKTIAECLTAVAGSLFHKDKLSSQINCKTEHSFV